MTAWARVSVAGPTSSIDVGLPSDLPITDFLDELVLRLAGPADVTGPTLEWTLRPIGRDALAPQETLRGAGIDDGTWLLLREGPAEDPAVLIDDTLDALTETTGDRSWTAEAALRLGAAVAGCATIAGAAGLIVTRATATAPAQAVAGAVAIIGAVTLLVAALYCARFTELSGPLPAALCAMAAALSGAAGFIAVPGNAGPEQALLAVVAATTCAAITLRLTRVAPITHLAAITAGCLAVGAAAVGRSGMDRAPVAALTAVAALLLVLAAPRLTILLAKIPLPPVPSPGEPIDPVEVPPLPTIDAVDAVSLSALPDIAALTRRAEHARGCLTGLCLGAAAVAAVAATTIGFATPDWRFAVIAVGVGIALVLRGRSHTDLLQALALAGGGAAALVGFLAAAIVSAALGEHPSRPLTAALAALAVAAIALAVGGWSAGRTFSPLQRRAAELGEYALLVVLLPLLLWALDLYRMIREAW